MFMICVLGQRCSCTTSLCYQDQRWQHKKYLALIAVVHFMPHRIYTCVVLASCVGGLALGYSHLGGSPHSQSLKQVGVPFCHPCFRPAFSFVPIPNVDFLLIIRLSSLQKTCWQDHLDSTTEFETPLLR